MGKGETTATDANATRRRHVAPFFLILKIGKCDTKWRAKEENKKQMRSVQLLSSSIGEGEVRETEAFVVCCVLWSITQHSETLTHTHTNTLTPSAGSRKKGGWNKSRQKRNCAAATATKAKAKANRRGFKSLMCDKCQWRRERIAIRRW